MKDIFIGQNVRLLCDLLEQTDRENIPSILLQLNFRNAFDTIKWLIIQQVLSIFNFGVSIKRWIETFYCNAESSVINKVVSLLIIKILISSISFFYNLAILLFSEIVIFMINSPFHG